MTERIERVAVTLCTQDADELDEAARVLIFHPPGRKFDRNLRHELEDVGFAITGFGPDDNAEYDLTSSATWASGDVLITVADYALMWAGGGVVGNAAWESFKAFGRKLAAKHKQDAEQRPLTDGEAEVWGLEMIAGRYGLAVSDLKLTSVKLSGSNATVSAYHLNGCRYTANLEVLDGLVALGDTARETS
jgi:hypothetical protein